MLMKPLTKAFTVLQCKLHLSYPSESLIAKRKDRELNAETKLHGTYSVAKRAFEKGMANMWPSS